MSFQTRCRACWTVGPVNYRRGTSGALAPLLVRNRLSVWYTGGIPDVALDDADNQYRAIAVHAPAHNGFTGASAIPRLVGQFDQAKIKPFDPLSEVPLGPFQPRRANPRRVGQPAGPRSPRKDLLPSLNLGGYVSQPPQLLTTLAALPTFENSSGISAVTCMPSDPIRVIRVHVADVTGPDPHVVGTCPGGRPADSRAYRPRRRYRDRVVARAENCRASRLPDQVNRESAAQWRSG